MSLDVPNLDPGRLLQFHDVMVSRAQDDERRLAALDQETPAEAAPAVRSVWQLQKTSPEDHLQDTPAAFHWGSANVTDTPLFAGAADAPQPTPVIPEKALRQAKKTAKQGG